ncbi:MAG: D-aminoacyl-tRNA deacylase [Polyangiales bacterium]
MRVVAQRVTSAGVEIDGCVVGQIDRGLLVYLAVATSDDQRDVDWLVEKLAALRVFPDEAGKLGRSIIQTGFAILLVRQFTLLADVRKGRRPSFTEAMAQAPAEHLYEAFVAALRARGIPVATGRFRADMKVHSLNDGPITLVIDSPREEAARNPGAPHLRSSGLNFERLPPMGGSATRFAGK